MGRKESNQTNKIYNPIPLDLYNGAIPSLLYQTRGKNPLVYKGFLYLKGDLTGQDNYLHKRL